MDTYKWIEVLQNGTIDPKYTEVKQSEVELLSEISKKEMKIISFDTGRGLKPEIIDIFLILGVAGSGPGLIFDKQNNLRYIRLFSQDRKKTDILNELTKIIRKHEFNLLKVETHQ